MLGIRYSELIATKRPLANNRAEVSGSCLLEKADEWNAFEF